LKILAQITMSKCRKMQTDICNRSIHSTDQQTNSIKVSVSVKEFPVSDEYSEYRRYEIARYAQL